MRLDIDYLHILAFRSSVLILGTPQGYRTNSAAANIVENPKDYQWFSQVIRCSICYIPLVITESSVFCGFGNPSGTRE